jgi:hypothetical protein
LFSGRISSANESTQIAPEIDEYAPRESNVAGSLTLAAQEILGNFAAY